MKQKSHYYDSLPSLSQSFSIAISFCQLSQRLEYDWSVLLRYLLIGSLSAMCCGILTHSEKRRGTVYGCYCVCVL